MSNIPTQLLRTLVTVVDQRSFTQAARTLGLTQPAVSAHIKRLQRMLGCDLFDRSGADLRLTAKGESIVEHARHLLSINDLILRVARPRPGAQMVRLGVPSDFLGGNLPRLLTSFRKQWPNVRFSVYHDGLEPHLSELRRGQLDIAIGLSLAEPATEARHHWPEKAYWVRGRSTDLRDAGPVPLVSFREDCIYYRAAVNALGRCGRGSELVFIGPTIVTLAAAVSAGFGVMVLPRSRVWPPELSLWEDAPLPALPNLYWGVYLREGAERELPENIADAIAAEMRARSAAAADAGSKRAAVPTLAFARRAAMIN